jgi:hypothetical protein
LSSLVLVSVGLQTSVLSARIFPVSMMSHGYRHTLQHMCLLRQLGSEGETYFYHCHQLQDPGIRNWIAIHILSLGHQGVWHCTVSCFLCREGSVVWWAAMMDSVHDVISHNSLEAHRHVVGSCGQFILVGA